MKQKLYLIYITGLGDSDPKGQRKAVSLWHWWGVKAEMFQVKWADKEPWEPKLERLLARIDELAKDNAVGLVAASAGASAAINAYAARKRKLIGMVLIAGKVNRPDAIGQNYRQKNPAFITSAQDSVKALASLTDTDRSRILSRYALADELVTKADSRIPGARNRLVPSIGHFLTIATQITVGAPSFIYFLKRCYN